MRNASHGRRKLVKMSCSKTENMKLKLRDLFLHYLHTARRLEKNEDKIYYDKRQKSKLGYKVR